MTFTDAFAQLGYRLSSPRTDWSATKEGGVCISIWAKEMRPKRPGSAFDTRTDAQPIETWNHKQGFKRRLPHLSRAISEFGGYVDVVVVTGTPGEGHGSADPWIPGKRQGYRWRITFFDPATGHFAVETFAPENPH